MIDVWWIGPGVLMLVATTAIIGGVRQPRHAIPLAIATILAGGGYAIAWAIARHAMRGHAGTFESAFLQLAFASVAAFGFVVVAMIAARFWRRSR